MKFLKPPFGCIISLLFIAAWPTWAKDIKPKNAPINLKSTAEQELKIQSSGKVFNTDQTLTEALVIKSDAIPRLSQPQRAKFIGINAQAQDLQGHVTINETDIYPLSQVGSINMLGFFGGYSINKNSLAEGQVLFTGGANYGRKEINLFSGQGVKYSNTYVQIMSANLGGKYQRAFSRIPRLSYSGTLAGDFMIVSQTADLDSAKWAKQLGYANVGVGLRYNLVKTAFVGGEIFARAPLQKYAISASTLNYSINLGTEL